MLVGPRHLKTKCLVRVMPPCQMFIELSNITHLVYCHRNANTPKIRLLGRNLKRKPIYLDSSREDGKWHQIWKYRFHQVSKLEKFRIQID